MLTLPFLPELHCSGVLRAVFIDFLHFANLATCWGANASHSLPQKKEKSTSVKKVGDTEPRCRNPRSSRNPHASCTAPDLPSTASDAAGVSEVGDLVFASLLAKARWDSQLDLLKTQEEVVMDMEPEVDGAC